MHYYREVTNRRRLGRSLLGSVVAASILLSGSSAAAVEADPAEQPAPATATTLAEQSELEQLRQEVVELRQDLRTSRARVIRQRDRIVRQRDRIAEGREREAQQATVVSNSSTFGAKQSQWQAGYQLGGGQNLAAFENVILPCESGGSVTPFEAVSRTNDWGRAQINRPTWEPRFEALTGVEFTTGILDPTLNGYMAAVVEREHSTGLSAWTCWRKR